MINNIKGVYQSFATTDYNETSPEIAQSNETPKYGTSLVGF